MVRKGRESRERIEWRISSFCRRNGSPSQREIKRYLFFSVSFSPSSGLLHFLISRSFHFLCDKKSGNLIFFLFFHCHFPVVSYLYVCVRSDFLKVIIELCSSRYSIEIQVTWDSLIFQLDLCFQWELLS